MIEALERRTMFAAINTSSVALVDATGNPATINRHMAVFLLIHGDNMNVSLMTDMAAAVKAQLPADQWQVLILDWSVLAAAQTNASKNALAVGDRVAAMVNAARLPAARFNMIGFSMGGTVMGRAAKDLKSQSTQVNTLIGIDPAAGRYEAADYAENSNYSIAFGARDRYGGELGALSADDAVLLYGLDSVELTRHSQTFAVVNNMWLRDGGFISKGNDGVSSLFSITSILEGSPIAWRHDRFAAGYEAQVNCGFQSGLPNDLGPLSLTWVNTRGHTQAIV